MPAAPKPKKSGAPKAKGAVRAKSGCYTCRIRRKKCDENPNGEGHCQTCVRLRLECLGFGAKRPDWLRENRNVVELREKIKAFLAAQGMIKGHSGAGPRAAEAEQPMLRLAEDYSSATESPPTPTLSLSSSDGALHRHHALHTSSIRDQDWPAMPLEPPAFAHGALHSPLVMRHDSPYGSASPGSYQNDMLYQALPPISTSLVPSHTSAWHPYASPATESSFGAIYNYLPNKDDYPDEQNSAYTNTANDYGAYLTIAPHTAYPVDALLEHYMRSVVDVQYLLADPTIPQMIYHTINTHDYAGKAARLLSSVHWHRFRQGDSVALQQPEIQDHFEKVRGMLTKTTFSGNDAMAALHVVSAYLFDGGTGAWQEWLDVACRFSDSVLHNPTYNGPADALMRCDAKVGFIVRTSMWFDVLAAITNFTSPHFLSVFRQLFDPAGAHIEGAAVPAELSMMAVMGCENHIVWALAEVSDLAVWKQRQLHAGRLSVPALVARGQEIDQFLKRGAGPGPGAQERDHDRHLTSEIFRASARVYLHAVVSGDHPSVGEIREGVGETLAALADVPETGPAGVSRRVVRSTVFGIFICGCLTDDARQRRVLLERLRMQQAEKVGNCSSVQRLLEDVWAARDAGGVRGRGQAVEWRKALRDARMLLV